LFLVDLNLGDGRGTDLVREIKKRWPSEETVVLLLSTSNLEEDRLDAESAKVSRYVLKHDDPNQFSEQMTELIKEFFAIS
jgi:DNA-binding NarL/FixJ family response regulator